VAAFVAAITGGVASGKSELGRRFERLGVVLVDADLAARDVVAVGQPALDEIAALFGRDILRADGQLDRARLRAIVFENPAQRRALETITHPRIRSALKSQCSAAAGEYVLVAIPLLAEGGGRTSYPWLQRILVVDAPPWRQKERLMARDRASRELAERMIAAQSTRAQRLGLADDIVINDAEPDALQAPVERLDALYRRLASGARGP
jgi:dephospho-CoA kinase